MWISVPRRPRQYIDDMMTTTQTDNQLVCVRAAPLATVDAVAHFSC